MERARELAESRAGANVAVVADYQTAGRGTKGREWIAPPNTCLMFTTSSLTRITPDLLPLLPGMVANVVAETVQRICGVISSVKPPNDVVTRNGKLAGVLCGSRLYRDRVEWVNCGIGLNTFMKREQLPTAFSTSLALEAPFVPDHLFLLQNLLDNLEFILADAPIPQLAADRQSSC
jgi:BirA family biotin operon repressor/biotin-[acetyl-CoA-carboxylase] ligase